jgi:DNA polymerase I
MIMGDQKKFYLIDGSSYIYRAFYAIGRLTNSRGMPTQAVYGFNQMILKVLREENPDYVCMIFDAPGRTFRSEFFGEYKATRQKMPEDLTVQIPYIKDLVNFHGIPQMELEGYEADDLIATLTKWCREQNVEVVIVSGDKDLLQLIEDPHVRQWDPQKDKVFTEKEVIERFGVTPPQMIDLLALMGDSIDNIPGVKGIGEKTAKGLLQKWGSLDEIYAHLDAVTPPSVRKKLEENKDNAYLSRKLVSFKQDVVIPHELSNYARAPASVPDLMKLYSELEFNTLIESLREQYTEICEQVVPEAARFERESCIVVDEQEFKDLLERIKKQESFSIDLETTSQNPMLARIVGVALCWEYDTAYYLPIAHSGPNSERQLTAEKVLELLRPLLSRPEPGKVGQNIKYEWVVLKRHGVELKGIVFDTMVASYLLDPERRSHRLERVVAEHLQEGIGSYTELTGKGKNQIGFHQVDVHHAADYACGDANAAWRLKPILEEKLAGSKLDHLYQTLELPLIEVLAGMEYRGILVDSEKLESLSIELEKSMDQRAAWIYELAGEEFNIQSPKQLASVLFDKLCLRVVKKTKSGPSTDVNVLEQLAAEHPIVEHILCYRSLSKLKGTYTDALFRLIHPETGRIHTSFNQTVTATGRLSSSDPNLQNIPIRSDEGRKIREAFIASPGWCLLSADYSQIELRILAHYSQDAHLVEAFRENADVHRRTAAEMFGIPPHEVTPEMRRQAKMINFGIIYGMGPFGLAQRLYISNKMAKAAIDRYFEKYEGVRRFIDSVIHTARQVGYTETLLGRKRALPELSSRNRTIRMQGERLAINTPIQGTAADLIKKAMIDVDQALRRAGLNTAMLLQVHDELLFEVPLEELDEAKEVIRRCMESVWPLSVPLLVDIGWGTNWTESHP